MIKCICFARVSTLQQDLTAQIEVVRRQAIADGYLDSEIAIVEGKESAIKLDEEQRQTLKELKELVKVNPTVESIYFFAVDRLARRMSIILSVKEWADDNKINLAFIHPHRMNTIRVDENGKRVEDDMTTLLLSMLAYGAQMEMKTKKARFKTSKDALRKQGKIAEGRVMFGYKLDENRYIVPDEEVTAPLVRGIFNDYLTGEYTLASLHNKYVKAGVFKPDVHLATQKRRVYFILSNETYTGREIKSKQKNKNTGTVYQTAHQYPAIISGETFDKVQELLKQKRNQPKIDIKHTYYCKGIIKCHCGRIMSAKSSSVRYVCTEYGHTLSANINVVDSLAWNTAKAWYAFYATLDMQNSKAESLLRIEDYEKEIQVLDEKIQIENDRRDRIATQYANGRVSDKVFEAIVDECDNNIKSFNKSKAQFATAISKMRQLIVEADNKEYVSALDLKYLPDEERVKIIRQVIKEVKISKLDNEDIKIEFVPNEILEFAIKPETNNYYIYNSKKDGKVGQIKLEAWLCGKCINPDVTFLVHKRFERRDTARARKKLGLE